MSDMSVEGAPAHRGFFRKHRLEPAKPIPMAAVELREAPPVPPRVPPTPDRTPPSPSRPPQRGHHRLAALVVLGAAGAGIYGATKLESKKPEVPSSATNDYACLVAKAKADGTLADPEKTIVLIQHQLNPSVQLRSDVLKIADALRNGPVGNILTEKERENVVTIDIQPPERENVITLDNKLPEDVYESLKQYAVVSLGPERSVDHDAPGYVITRASGEFQALRPTNEREIELVRSCKLPNGQKAPVKVGWVSNLKSDNKIVIK